jgi:hypothetical protein
MKNVSFLIGSGFSVPAGYPTATKLNNRLRKIDASKIRIDTSGDAMFLEGQNDPNAHWMRVEQRKFVEEFLQFYNEVVLGPEQSFHYETFYDYYRQFYGGKPYTDELRRFIEEFKKRHHVTMDAHHLLLHFNNTFNQLIAQELSKKLERVHLTKPYHPDYDAFLRLVEKLAETHKVHLHTLNHDLYLEHLALSDSIQAEMDDGFEELGSPFFGELRDRYERYMVRLSRFTNKYERRSCLYKLHGSIDFYSFQDHEGSHLLRGKRRMRNLDFYKETENDGKRQYIGGSRDFYPEFLSGTTFKKGRYGEGPYYPKVLDHFIRNLRDSNTLIVIGYGFRDSGINKRIDEFFGAEKKAMFIVDVEAPDTKYLQSDDVFFVDRGVSGMDIQYILNNWRP